MFLLVQFLGGVGGQAPAILVNHGVAVAGRHLEKALIGFGETTCEILRYPLGIGGQTRTAKKVLTYTLPMEVVDEELLQPCEPFAVADREIAGLKLVAQLEQQGALPGPPVNLAGFMTMGLRRCGRNSVGASTGSLRRPVAFSSLSICNSATTASR